VLVEREPDMFALLDELQEYSKAVIVDAVEMGAAPGSLRIFTAGELESARIREISSTHGFGLRELVELAGELDVRTEILVAGIQVRDVSFGEELSPELAARLDVLAGELGGLLGT
jgi:hydrogenase maturation protease